MSSEFDDIVIIGTSPASSLPKHRRTSSRDSQSNTDVMDSETRFPPFSSSSDAPGPAVSSLPHRYPPHSCLTDTLKEPPPSVNKPKNTSTSVQTHTSTSANPPMGASFNVNSKMAVVPMELLLELTRGGSRQNDGEPRYNQKGMNPVDYPGPFQSVPFGLPPPPLPQPPPPMPEPFPSAQNFTIPPTFMSEPPPLPPPFAAPPVVEILPRPLSQLPRTPRPSSVLSSDDEGVHFPSKAKSWPELFPAYSETSDGPEDRFVLLSPFRRTAYVLYGQAKQQDFDHFSIALRSFTPYKWHTWPTAGQVQRLNTSLAIHNIPMLDTIRAEFIIGARNNCNSSSFKPQIFASSPLTDDGEDVDCVHEIGESCICFERSETLRQTLESTALVYFLVFRAWHNTVGEILSVVRCSSRGAAAAEVFYRAGELGQSMDFAAVMKASDIEAFETGTVRIKHYKRLSSLIEDETEEKFANNDSSYRTVKVFY